MAFFAAGHGIDLIQRPFADTALEDHDIAVIDVSNYVVFRAAPEQLFVNAADMLCGILVFPAEIAVLIKVIVVVTDTGHAVQVIYVVFQ